MTAKLFDRLYWIFLAITAATCFIGCTVAELKEGASNAGAAAADAASRVAADPSLIATPAGLATLVGAILAGFLTREAASASKNVASGTAGAAAKFFTKLFSKAPPSPPEAP